MGDPHLQQQTLNNRWSPLHLTLFPAWCCIFAQNKFFLCSLLTPEMQHALEFTCPQAPFRTPRIVTRHQSKSPNPGWNSGMSVADVFLSVLPSFLRNSSERKFSAPINRKNHPDSKTGQGFPCRWWKGPAHRGKKFLKRHSNGECIDWLTYDCLTRGVPMAIGRSIGLLVIGNNSSRFLTLRGHHWEKLEVGESRKSNHPLTCNSVLVSAVKNVLTNHGPYDRIPH